MSYHSTQSSAQIIVERPHSIPTAMEVHLRASMTWQDTEGTYQTQLFGSGMLGSHGPDVLVWDIPAMPTSDITVSVVRVSPSGQTEPFPYLLRLPGAAEAPETVSPGLRARVRDVEVRLGTVEENMAPMRERLATIEAFLRAHGVPTEPTTDSTTEARCPVWLNSQDVCVHCSLFAGHHGDHQAAGNAVGPLVEYGWRWRQCPGSLCQVFPGA